jgi:hypothetical protein
MSQGLNHGPRNVDVAIDGGRKPCQLRVFGKPDQTIFEAGESSVERNAGSRAQFHAIQILSGQPFDRSDECD